jgi:hypothetical protein
MRCQPLGTMLTSFKATSFAVMVRTILTASTWKRASCDSPSSGQSGMWRSVRAAWLAQEVSGSERAEVDY